MNFTINEPGALTRRFFFSAAFTLAAACAPKTAPAPSAPEPAPVAARPTVMQTCPGPTDGPSIVVGAIEDAARALAADPATPLPPACVVSAYVRLPIALPDSIDAHARAIAAELRRRGAGTSQGELLSSEVLLLARTGRYAEASRTYDALVAVVPQPAMDVVRVAVAAAAQRGDNAAVLRILTANMARADAPPTMRSEANVLRQSAALRSAIDEARGLVRQNPKYLAAYPSLIGNFGTLGMADSVVAYIRRALAQGATRASLTSAVDPLVNTMLRQAALYGSAYGWPARIAAASRVDSALTSPSTRFLVAALIAQSIEPQVGEISAQVTGTSWLPASQARGGSAAPDRAAGCARIAELLRSIELAEAKLRDGGSRYTGGGVSSITSGLAAERNRLTELRDRCV